MEHALRRISEWILSPYSPAFVLIYLGLFGIEAGRFRIHGIVTSIWVGAQAMNGIREELRGIRGDVTRLENKVDKVGDKIEKLVDAANKPDDSLRFSIMK